MLGYVGVLYNCLRFECLVQLLYVLLLKFFMKIKICDKLLQCFDQNKDTIRYPTLTLYSTQL